MKAPLNGWQKQLERQRAKRDRRIIALRAQGKSFGQIADIVGLTRMRCKQIIDREAAL